VGSPGSPGRKSWKEVLEVQEVPGSSRSPGSGDHFWWSSAAQNFAVTIIYLLIKYYTIKLLK
jgi:hypothetical protein